MRLKGRGNLKCLNGQDSFASIGIIWKEGMSFMCNISFFNNLNANGAFSMRSHMNAYDTLNNCYFQRGQRCSMI